MSSKTEPLQKENTADAVSLLSVVKNSRDREGDFGERLKGKKESWTANKTAIIVQPKKRNTTVTLHGCAQRESSGY